MSFTALSFLGGCFNRRREGELLIWWPGADIEIASINRAAELFQAANPEVSFRIIPRPTTNFAMDYLVARQGHNYPDIVFLDSVFVPQLANMGFLTNLSEFDPAIETTIRSQVVDSIWPANLHNGDAYALPVSANVLTLAHNRTLLNRVFLCRMDRGFTDADVPSTWDEKMEIAQLVLNYNAHHGLTGPDALIPYTIPIGADHRSMGAMYFVSMSARMGGRIMNEDLTEVMFAMPENVAAAQKIFDMGRANRVATTWQEGAFEGGRVAFIEMGPWKINQYQMIEDSRGYEFRFAPLVQLTEGGGRQSGLGLFSMAVSKGALNEALAVEFMKFFLTNDEVMLLHNVPQNLIPVTNSTITDEHFTRGHAWPVFMEQLNHVVARPGTHRWVTMESAIGDLVARLVDGSRTPQAGLFDMQQYFS